MRAPRGKLAISVHDQSMSYGNETKAQKPSMWMKTGDPNKFENQSDWCVRVSAGCYSKHQSNNLSTHWLWEKINHLQHRVYPNSLLVVFEWESPTVQLQGAFLPLLHRAHVASELTCTELKMVSNMTPAKYVQYLKMGTSFKLIIFLCWCPVLRQSCALHFRSHRKQLFPVVF